MVVSFVRIDDRMIHGQTVTRWAKEKPCDGLSPSTTQQLPIRS